MEVITSRRPTEANDDATVDGQMCVGWHLKSVTITAISALFIHTGARGEAYDWA